MINGNLVGTMLLDHQVLQGMREKAGDGSFTSASGTRRNPGPGRTARCMPPPKRDSSPLRRRSLSKKRRTGLPSIWYAPATFAGGTRRFRSARRGRSRTAKRRSAGPAAARTSLASSLFVPSGFRFHHREHYGHFRRAGPDPPVDQTYVMHSGK